MPGLNSIEGLISGLSTSSIVQSLLSPENQSINRLKAESTEKETELSIWQQINSNLLGLKNISEELQETSLYQNVQVTSSDSTVISAEATSGSAIGNYYFKVQQLAQNHQLISQGFPTSDQTSIGRGTLTLQVGDNSEISINITSGNNDTLEALKNAINDSDAGITATIINNGSSNNPYQLILTSAETGQSNLINVDSSIFGGWGLVFETMQSAQDAEVQFGISGSNSTPITIKSASNTLTNLIEGLTLELHQAEPDSLIKITVEPSNSSLISKVEDFVSKYNLALNYVNEQLQYDMETQTAGTLQADTNLQTIQAQLRELMQGYTDHQGIFHSASEFGFDTGEKGVITLNQTQLQEASDNNFEELASFLSEGIAQNFIDYLKNLTNPNSGFINNRTELLNDQIDSFSSQIQSLESQMAIKEERLYEEFTNLETYLASMQSQSTYMQNQLSGLNSNWSFIQ